MTFAKIKFLLKATWLTTDELRYLRDVIDNILTHRKERSCAPS